MSRRKIVMIGPVYPYKGGISHYTSLMYQSLSQEHDVYMLSYKLQYPRFLFKKEQKDYANDSFKIENTDFYINTANPINWIYTAKRIRALCPDLVIFQWWHPYFSPCYWTICRLLGKIKILFMCHNVFPHERFPMDRFLTKMTLSHGDFFIVQSVQDENDLISIKKDAVYRKTVHPTYNIFKLYGLSKAEGRALLKLPDKEKVLLFFGFIREYKGLKYLIRALPKVMNSLENIKLLIVGEFNGDKEIYMDLISKCQVENHVEVYDQYIPDIEVEKYFAASDLVVLPYESSTQSGIVQIAYGFEKPVIATDVGGLPEVVIHEKTGYIVKPMDSEQLADKIICFYRENKEKDFQKEIRRESYKYSWDRMRETVDDLMNIKDF